MLDGAQKYARQQKDGFVEKELFRKKLSLHRGGREKEDRGC